MSPTTISEPAPPVGQAELAALDPEQREAAVRRSPGHLGWAAGLRVLVMLGRPRTCVPGLLGFAWGWARGGGAATWQFFLGLLMSVVYGLLANVYNAYTDLAEDSRNLPSRVWLVLLVGPRRMLAAGHAMVLALLALAPLYGVAYLVPMALALAGALQYSFRPLRLKARPWLGPVGMSLAVFGPYLLGYFGTGVRMPSGAAWAVPAFLILWFVPKGMIKNLPDVEGDRAAGLRTSATVFATREAAARVAMAATLTGYLSLALFVAGGALPPRTLFALPLVVAAFRQCRAMVGAPDAATANAVLKRDMLLSTGYLVAVLLLDAFDVASVCAVALGALLLFGSDLLALDSRQMTAPAAPAAPTDS
ncbi:UbiA family prenyltransferase [Streptomyces sp. Y1]|uniref:UbiA family prenyltransferase n=1 Tax=Streptomyces sp. Y1 TaxID=3238634 RepID=A0AB39TF50_9ACTN